LEESKNPSSKKSTEINSETANQNDSKANESRKKEQKKDIQTNEKERYAKKNEPKKRRTNYSIFLIIGIIGLVILLIYLLSISGLFNNDAIATINGEKIIVEDFKSAYSQLPAELQTKDNKELLLSQMINRTLVLQDASKKGISVSDTEISNVLQSEYRSNFQSEEDYKNALEYAGITEDNLIKLIYYQISEEKLINHLFPNITVEASEVEEFFEQNKESISGFYEAYFGITIGSIDDIYEEIEEIVVLNKTIYLFSDYVGDLLSKSEITINTALLDKIEVYKEDPNDILSGLNVSDFVISSEEIENTQDSAIESTPQEQVDTPTVSDDTDGIVDEGESNDESFNLANSSLEGTEEAKGSEESLEEPLNESSDEILLTLEEAIICFEDKGYLKKDVLVLYDTASESYDEIIGIINATTDEFSYELIEIGSDDFNDIKECLDETLSSGISGFMCIADFSTVTKEFNAENLENTLFQCKN
jgi:parvulin-like peptidyl-prolyl isomerase